MEKSESREIPVKGAEVVFSVVQWITNDKREAAQTWGINVEESSFKNWRGA